MCLFRADDSNFHQICVAAVSNCADSQSASPALNKSSVAAPFKKSKPIASIMFFNIHLYIAYTFTIHIDQHLDQNVGKYTIRGLFGTGIFGIRFIVIQGFEGFCPQQSRFSNLLQQSSRPPSSRPRQAVFSLPCFDCR